MAISPDNRWVVTPSDDNTARLWLLQMKDLMHLARYFPGEKYRKTLKNYQASPLRA